MSKKGQAELIIIIAVVAVAVVVIYYALNIPLAPIVPPGMELIKNSVDNFILEGARDTLYKQYEYGGYLEPQVYSVNYLNKPRTYYIVGGRTDFPNLETEFVNGLTDYLTANKAYLEESLEKEGVTSVGNPTVTAKFFRNRVEATVKMKVQSTKGEVSDFKAEVFSDIKKIFDFSKKLAQEQNTDRYFETFTVASFLSSDFKGGHPAVPLNIVLIDCGGFLSLDWDDVRPEAEKAIKATVAHTYLPGKVPLNTYHTSPYPKYSLASLSGNEYSSIDVNFQLPDDFRLDYSNFDMSPDPINVFAEPIPMIGECVSDPVSITYDIFYPVIVEVKDEQMDKYFRFSLPVFINDNLPGDWDSGAGDEEEALCASKYCEVDVTVLDTGGRPVQGAVVSFMGCRIGTTDSNGELKGGIPCGAGYLEVKKGGYGYYKESLNDDNVKGLVVSLKKQPVVNLKFFEVVVQNHPTLEQYWIPKGNVNYIDSNEARDESVHLAFSPLNNEFCDTSNLICERYFEGMSGSLTAIRPNRYRAVATLYDSGLQVAYGAVVDAIEIREDMDGKDLFVYLPQYLGFENVDTVGEQSELAVILTGILKRCGLGPFKETEADLEDKLPCIVNYSDLE